MRSISIKITLVLVIVSLIGAIFTAFFVQNRTRTAFDKFIRSQDQETLVDRLTEHYLQNGGWENPSQVFQEVFPAFEHNPGDGNPGNQPTFPAPFFLAAQDGTVLTGIPGQGGPKPGNQIPLNELEKGIPIEVDGDLVGWLLPAQIQRPRNNSQQDFLGTVNQGLMISSLVTLLIALALGGILIQSFTRPIRELVGATEKVASGELGYQVEINAKDELGKLASSFNRMSSDLHRADQSRKQMTSDIAHDLRTPLTILQGYTEVLSEGRMEATPEIFQTMHQQAQHLSYLIDDLKTLSLLDSEELSFQIQEIDPGRILQQVEDAFSPLASANGVKISTIIQPELPRAALDPDRLTQILGNLISNAIHVMPQGGQITLSAESTPGTLLLHVEDNGPGIAAQDLPRIFDRSYRTDQSRSGNGSSGLGLAITRKLVEAQGGQITAASEPGQGTKFTIKFPAS